MTRGFERHGRKVSFRKKWLLLLLLAVDNVKSYL
jgi:hypothetical protein